MGRKTGENLTQGEILSDWEVCGIDSGRDRSGAGGGCKVNTGVFSLRQGSEGVSVMGDSAGGGEVNAWPVDVTTP